MTDKQVITIYTDGASRGNPGPGGWGATIILPTGKVIELGGAEGHTTNNRMELTALLKVLEHVKKYLKDGEKIIVHSDSSYVLQGITKWVYGWFKNGWVTGEGDPVANRDIWEPLYQLVWFLKPKADLVFEKVAGHAGVLGNERADLIATKFADGERILLYTGGLRDYERLLEDSVALKKTKPSKSKTNTGPAYSYVSMVGDLIETHKTWTECEARVKGKSGAKFKKAKTIEEESDIISEWTALKRE